MNAVELEFENNTFDKVLCIQNGISAFHVDKIKLIKESLRVVKPDGKVFFSSYSYKFWNHRMKWFEKQSEAGLIGKINYNKSKNGKIVCEDGFSADTVGKRDFNKLLSEFESITYKLTEVDNSCIFCEIIPHKDYFAKK
jgi:2-polyprenyl-6-hydroxyphenyl methylase/3-demethylubiquinone-9 3-methyltransferase